MPKTNLDNMNSGVIEPLPKGRYKHCVLEEVRIFRSERSWQGSDPKPCVLLSLYWNPGDMYKIELDDGSYISRYIVDGFVLLSNDARGNLLKILRPLGFDREDFFVQTGKTKGNLNVEHDFEFGQNKLGVDYSQKDFDDLPFYVSKKTEGKKGDLEVQLTKWCIEDIPVIGRWLDIDVGVNGQYNNISLYMASDEPAPLVPVSSEETALNELDLEDEPEPQEDPKLTKLRVKTAKLFDVLNVNEDEQGVFTGFVLSEEDPKRWESLAYEEMLLVAKELQKVYKKEANLEDYLNPSKTEGDGSDDLDLDDLEADLPF